MVDNRQKAQIAGYSNPATAPISATSQFYTPERGGNVATAAMYANPLTAPLMVIPGVRGSVREFGRNPFGRGNDGDPAPYNPGNLAAMPYAQKYGGRVNQAIQENSGITAAELQQIVFQEEQDRARQAQEAQINAYFADPMRAQRFNQQYDAELAQSQNTLANQTQASMRQQAQRQATRGTMGGSTDIENRAGIAGGYQSTLSDLAQRRTQAGQAQQMSDVNEKTSLLGMVNAADPFSRQQAQAGLSGLAGQGAAAQGYISAALNRERAGQTGDNLQSEAIGGGLSGFARGLGTYGDRRTRAGYSGLWGG